MPTSFLAIENDLLTFSTGLLGAARIATSAQLARHRLLSERSQPKRRAMEFLSSRPDVFEKIHGIYPYQWLWRLRRDYKRANGLTYRNVNASQRVEHWLAFGDLWIALYTNGYKIQTWFTEGRLIGGFDIYVEVNNRAYLVELQLTPLTAKEWRQKWYRRGDWLNGKPWMNSRWKERFNGVQPQILLVTKERMKNVLLPKNGVTYVDGIEKVATVLPRVWNHCTKSSKSNKGI